MSNAEPSLREKALKLEEQFTMFNRAIQDMLSYGDNVAPIILHDFQQDIKAEEIDQIETKNGPSSSKLTILRTIVAVNSLTEEDRTLIRNEFIKPQSNHWWEEKYSRSKYYRRRRTAISRLYSLLF